jgi:hypothetical protein
MSLEEELARLMQPPDGRRRGERRSLMRSLPFLVTVAIVSLSTPMIGSAASPCPPEVKEARELLTTKTATSKTTQPPRAQAAARGQDVQAPRGQDVQAPRGQNVQAPRGQDVQAPRGQDVQAPRGQDVQAPRGQDVQAPRGQDVQAPRGQDVQSPRGQDVQAPRGQDVQAPRNAAKGRAAALANARKLVGEAETACKDADGPRAAANARAAMELLKYVP